MNYDDALKAAVHATGMFELAERPWPEGLEQFASEEPAPQKMKDALWKDGEKIMAEVLEAVGYKDLLDVIKSHVEFISAAPCDGCDRDVDPCWRCRELQIAHDLAGVPGNPSDGGES